MWEDSTNGVHCSGGGAGVMTVGAQNGDLAGRVGEDGLLPEPVIPGRGYGCSWYREHDVQRHRQVSRRRRMQLEIYGVCVPGASAASDCTRPRQTQK